MAPPPPPPPPPPPEVEGFTPSITEQAPMQNNVMNGPTSTPVEDNASLGAEKIWERPWSLEEMRKGAPKWSLAGDAGLLLYLEQFSKNMLARTHETGQQVDGLVGEAKAAGVRVHNVFNEFIHLANTQFVENRVYDEDVSTENKEEEKKADQQQEKTREQRETELIPKMCEAIKFGLEVVDTAFEKLDVDVANSDSEDEETGYKVDPIFEAKDPYINRPLPFIIGSAQFVQHDDVGLADYSSEEEEASDHGSISESESESEEEDEGKDVQKAKKDDSSEYTETESETESDSDMEEKPKARKQTRKPAESDSEDGDLFGGSASEDEKQSDDETDQPTKSAGPGGFASELAAKIGSVPVPRRPKSSDEEEDDWEEDVKPKQHKKERTRTASTLSDASKKGKKTKERSKSKRESKKAVAASDDLFGPPPDEEDDSPFGTKGGLFSGGGGLFDDDEQSGGLFDDVPTKKKFDESEEDEEHDEIVEPVKTKQEKKGRTRSGHKIPAGGVSIFGDSSSDPFSKVSSNISDEEPEPETKPTTKTAAPSGGLFNDDEDADDLFATATKKSTAASKSTKPVKVSSATNLFDDDKEDDLFATISKPKKKESKPAADLFADDDDGDLFGDAAPKVVEPKEEVKKTKTAPKKKMPAGAVSMFGGAPNPLAAAIKAQRHASDNEEDEWSDASVPKPDTGKFSRSGSGSSVSSSPALNAVKQQGKITRSGSSSSNSLFAEEPEVTSAPPKESKPKAKPSLGLFDDDDDDDFFSAKPAQPTKARAASKTLFTADDEDDLFAGKPAKPADSGQKKKPAGGVALFGGEDLFGTSPKKVEEKAPAVAKPVQKPVAKAALSLFDDDDDESGGDLFGGPTKKTTEPAKPRSKSNLFQDEDMLFSTKDEDPTVDLFGSTSPLSSPSKTEKKPEVKAPASKKVDDDEDDLFSGSAKPSKKSEPKPIKSTKAVKKTDLFGSPSPKDDLFSSNPKRTSKDSKPNAVPDLFGSPSPKEDLFSANPKHPAEDIKEAQQGETEESTEPEAKKPWKPAGAVSMFGSFDPAAMLKKNKDIKKADPLSGPTQESSTVDQTDSVREPAPKPDLFGSSPKERSVSSSSIDGPSPFGSAGASPPKFKSVSPPKTAKGIGSLAASLAINPAAMLPGAAPPVKQAQSVAIGFDAPAQASTLHSLNKGRAKVQTKRRPPSRAARQAVVKQSAAAEPTLSALNIPIDSQDNVDAGLSRLPVTKTSPDIFGEDLIGEKLPSVTKGLATKSAISDDLFSKSPGTKVGSDFEDDLLGSKSKDRTDLGTNRNTGSLPKPTKTNADEDLFSKPSDDIFSAKPKKETSGDVMDIFDTKPTEKAKNILADDDDDLFADKPKKKDIVSDVPEIPKTKAKKPIETDDIFGDATVSSKDEDIFGGPAAKPKSKKKAAPTDDIFADDTDIFSDLPPSKPKEKKKKAVSSEKPLFKGGDDDIFADSASKPKVKKTTKKKSSKTAAASSASIFDSDAPSIFDDPLNAMK